MRLSNRARIALPIFASDDFMNYGWLRFIALAVLSSAADAQTPASGSGPAASTGSGHAWPSKTVRLIAPFTSGGAATRSGAWSAQLGETPARISWSRIAPARAVSSAPILLRRVADGLYDRRLGGRFARGRTGALESAVRSVEGFTHIALIGGRLPSCRASLAARERRKRIFCACQSAAGDAHVRFAGQRHARPSRRGALQARCGHESGTCRIKAQVSRWWMSWGHIHSISTTLTTASAQIRAGRLGHSL